MQVSVFTLHLHYGMVSPLQYLLRCCGFLSRLTTRYCGFLPAIHLSYSSCVSTITSPFMDSDPFRTSGRRKFHKQNLYCRFLSSFAGSIFWGKPHGCWYSRNSIHFHPEMGQTNIMDHILGIDHQLNRLIHHQVHFSCYPYHRGWPSSQAPKRIAIGIVVPDNISFRNTDRLYQDTASSS